jgi:hypothetical protein
MIAGVLESFERIEDPRLKSFVTYPLPEILFGAVVGTLCGAEDWEEIALVCEERLDFLRDYLPYTNGIPSHDTFERVFNALDSQLFSDCLATLNLASTRKWALAFLKKHPAKIPIKRKIKKSAPSPSFLKETLC